MKRFVFKIFFAIDCLGICFGVYLLGLGLWNKDKHGPWDILVVTGGLIVVVFLVFACLTFLLYYFLVEKKS